MATPISYPEINGHRFSFASIEANFNGVPILGIKSINYKSELKAGEVRGTSARKLGRTKGQQNASCDFEMYRLEWDLFRSTLGTAGIGYGETSFNIVVQYAELPLSPVVTDIVVGVRIEEADHSNTEGTDATTVKLTCSAMEILENGVPISVPNEIGL